MENITIKIFKATDEVGFFYDIYDTDEVDDNTESIDGGFCTSEDIKSAIEMASDQAIRLIK